MQENSNIRAAKPKLLDQVRQRIRTKHYSIRTEQAYVQWVKRFVLFHNKRHPLDMGEAEIGQFLTHLAVNGRVAVDESELRNRVKAAGGKWNPSQQVGWLPYKEVLDLGLTERIVD